MHFTTPILTFTALMAGTVRADCYSSGEWMPANRKDVYTHLSNMCSVGEYRNSSMIFSVCRDYTVYAKSGSGLVV